MGQTIACEPESIHHRWTKRRWQNDLRAGISAKLCRLLEVLGFAPEETRARLDALLKNLAPPGANKRGGVPARRAVGRAHSVPIRASL